MKYIVAGWICVAALSGLAQSAEGISDAEIQSAIDRLASSNPDPNPKGKWLVKPPANYDQAAQRKVKDAEALLKQLGIRAFPLLVKNSGDTRYSQSMSTSIWRSFSVGRVCVMIIGTQVDSIPGRYGYKTMPEYSWQVISLNPESWWKKHKSSTLLEMRIEAVKWTIEKERANYKNIGDFFEMTEAQWDKEVIEPLERHLKSLTRSQAGGAIKK